jgi:butyryl-CoA dehydrogenase
MKFRLTKQQEMIRKVVREFAIAEVEPIAAEIDEQERFPAENVIKMAEMGLLGIPFPEEYGGAGGDTMSFIICVEELSRVCASTGVILSTHTALGAQPIFQHGTEDQKRKYLIPLNQGKHLGAFALTEPNAGTDSAAQQTIAVKKDDHYIINGNKIFITNGGVADTYIIFAMTDKTAGNRGISAFILPKDTPGFSIGTYEKKMGIRGSNATELIFENVKLPVENLLGQENKGFKIAMQALDVGRIGIGSQALGIAQGALDQAKKYVLERIQFGKPIARQQGLQWMIADMETQIAAARYLVYAAAAKRDAREPFTVDAAMAKLFASETAMQVTTQAVQLFGGYGYTRNYPVERMMRDAKITEIYEGTSEVQRMVIAANALK